MMRGGFVGWLLAVAFAASAHGVEVASGGRGYAGEKLDGGVYRFAGIRYAAAPVGPRRWAPPQPLDPGTATQTAGGAFPPACMQGDGNVAWYRRVAASFGQPPDVVDPTPPVAEDCLFLNVWTPQPQPDAALPVMVWVHGGS
ncbi:MAG: carboxylesterase family protein, partial [Pseudomonadales bacterium]